MALRLLQWSSFSSQEQWCDSGYDLLDSKNIQKASEKVCKLLMEQRKATAIPDLKVFVMPPRHYYKDTA